MAFCVEKDSRRKCECGADGWPNEGSLRPGPSDPALALEKVRCTGEAALGITVETGSGLTGLAGPESSLRRDRTLDRLGSGGGAGAGAAGCDTGGTAERLLTRGSSLFVGDMLKADRAVTEARGLEDRKFADPKRGLAGPEAGKRGLAGDAGRSSIIGFRSGGC